MVYPAYFTEAFLHIIILLPFVHYLQKAIAAATEGRMRGHQDGEKELRELYLSRGIARQSEVLRGPPKY